MVNAKEMLFPDSSCYERIVQVASTLAIEDMYIGNDIIENLKAVALKEKTIDDCIAELDKIYER